MAHPPGPHGKGMGSLMDGSPVGMGELECALWLQRQAARAGFDWAEPEPVLEKLQEEVGELQAAMRVGNEDQVEDELGDLFFALVNLTRKLRVDPDCALRRANAKFERRFRALEQLAGSREVLNAMGLVEMEDLWQRVKAGTDHE